MFWPFSLSNELELGTIKGDECDKTSTLQSEKLLILLLLTIRSVFELQFTVMIDLADILTLFIQLVL